MRKQSDVVVDALIDAVIVFSSGIVTAMTALNGAVPSASVFMLAGFTALIAGCRTLQQARKPVQNVGQ